MAYSLRKFRENSIRFLPLIFCFPDPASCTRYKANKNAYVQDIKWTFLRYSWKAISWNVSFTSTQESIALKARSLAERCLFLRGFQLATQSAQWNRWVYWTLKSDKHIFQWFSRKNSASERKIATTKSIACVWVLLRKRKLPSSTEDKAHWALSSLTFVIPRTSLYRGPTVLLMSQLNPWTYKAGEGVFAGFFSFLDDKPSAPDVFSSCSFIPRARFETSLVMVIYYGYETQRHE